MRKDYPRAKMMTCATKDCEQRFLQKLHTPKIYCDDCAKERRRAKFQRNRERMIAKGQFNP